MGKLFKAISTILCVSIIFSVFSIPAYADNLLDPTYDPMWEAFSKTWGDMTEVAFTCPKCGANIRKKDGGTCPSCGFNAIIDDGTENNYRPGFQAGGGSASPGGVGRNPSGYAGEGVPNINQTGKLQFTLTPHCGYGYDTTGSFKECIEVDSSHLPCDRKLYGHTPNWGYYFQVNWTGTAPVTGGYYYIPDSNTDLGYVRGLSNGGVWNKDIYTGFDQMSADKHHLVGVGRKAGENIALCSKFRFSSGVDFFIYAKPLVLEVEPFEVDNTISNRNYITINNNTWNGNIYVDSSNKLTYIYPQYTVNNEVNISNNPIIYNNETKQYYTYNSETKNYYYITINAPESTPTPTPTPDVPTKPIVPDTQSLIIPKMNANTFTDDHGTWVAGGSSKYSDVFDFFYAFDRSSANFWETNASPCYLQIEIPDPENYYIDGYIMRISKFNNRYAKDWTLQGSDDGETWDDLDTQKNQNLSDMQEHKYSLNLRKAYKYYRLNMSNYASSMCSLSHFNLLGYDAKDVTFPTPTPTPTPDPGKPTPTPTPTPTPGGSGGGSGDTNNFWNIIIKDNNKTDKEHKGIFWALVSLLIAAITFVVNMLTAYKYLFPFLPDGVIAVINTCVAVLMIFVVIKFVMRVIK